MQALGNQPLWNPPTLGWFLGPSENPSGTFARARRLPITTRCATRMRGQREGTEHRDPQAEVRRLSPLLTQDRSEDRPASQPRHLQITRGSRTTRARGAVLQASLTPAIRSALASRPS